MTTLDTRTDTRPAVIDGEYHTTDAPAYVRNPHLFSVWAAVALTVGVAAGFGWAVWRDDPHAGLSFLALLVALGALVVQVRKFNAWDQA